MKGPPRLLDTDSPAGELLRRALEEENRSDEGRRPLRVPSPVRRPGAGTWLAGTAAAAAVALVFGGLRPGSSEAPPIRAEVNPPRLEEARKTEPALVASTSIPTEATSTLDRRERPTPREPLRSAPKVSAPEPEKSENCRTLTRAGDFRGAIGCFAAEARLGGMRGELAWLEKARIERRGLHDPRAALATLDEYVARHPGSSLRSEADLSRIELRIALGDSRRALELVREVRASGRASERAEELERLERRLAPGE